MFDQIPRLSLIFIISYAFGSISLARIALRLLLREKDSEVIRLEKMQVDEEEMNLPMGANTVSVKHGSAAGSIVALLDIIKGSAPTLVARLLFPEQPYYLVAALGVVTGHIWPVYFHFVGGVGIGTMMVSLLVIDWLSVPVSVLLSLVTGLLILRNIMVIFFILLLTFIPWMWFRFGDFSHNAFSVMLLILFMLAMIPSIRVYLKKIKDGTSNDLYDAMEQMPMGRGMNRILEFLRIHPRPQKLNMGKINRNLYENIGNQAT